MHPVNVFRGVFLSPSSAYRLDILQMMEGDFIDARNAMEEDQL